MGANGMLEDRTEVHAEKYSGVIGHGKVGVFV